MKTLALMLIAIAAFGLVGKGQTWQQGFVQLKGIDTPNAIGDAILGRLVFIGGDKDKLDTAKVVMLICDTTGLPLKNFSFKTIKYINVWNVYSIIGYEVTLTQQKIYDMMPVMYEQTIVARLDENKNNLPKNIIVWQTQKIKQ